jgi:hypothetical protein
VATRQLFPREYNLIKRFQSLEIGYNKEKGGTMGLRIKKEEIGKEDSGKRQLKLLLEEAARYSRYKGADPELASQQFFDKLTGARQTLPTHDLAQVAAQKIESEIKKEIENSLLSQGTFQTDIVLNLL